MVEQRCSSKAEVTLSKHLTPHCSLGATAPGCPLRQVSVFDLTVCWVCVSLINGWVKCSDKISLNQSSVTMGPVQSLPHNRTSQNLTTRSAHWTGLIVQPNPLPMSTNSFSPPRTGSTPIPRVHTDQPSRIPYAHQATCKGTGELPEKYHTQNSNTHCTTSIPAEHGCMIRYVKYLTQNTDTAI